MCMGVGVCDCLPELLLAVAIAAVVVLCGACCGGCAMIEECGSQIASNWRLELPDLKGGHSVH